MLLPHFSRHVHHLTTTSHTPLTLTLNIPLTLTLSTTTNSQAGIKMWVLTGDKMETAINIGFSCSLLNNSMKKIVLSSEKTEDSRQKAIKDEETAIEELERNFLLHFPKCVKKGKINIPKLHPHLFFLGLVKKKKYRASTLGLSKPLLDDNGEDDPSASEPQIPEYDQTDPLSVPDAEPEYAIIIDGKALAQFLPSTGFTDLSARFLEFAMKCKVVICCRVSPLQKVTFLPLPPPPSSSPTLRKHTQTHHFTY